MGEPIVAEISNLGSLPAELKLLILDNCFIVSPATLQTVGNISKELSSVDILLEALAYPALSSLKIPRNYVRATSGIGKSRFEAVESFLCISNYLKTIYDELGDKDILGIIERTFKDKNQARCAWHEFLSMPFSVHYHSNKPSIPVVLQVLKAEKSDGAIDCRHAVLSSVEDCFLQHQKRRSQLPHMINSYYYYY